MEAGHSVVTLDRCTVGRALWLAASLLAIPSLTPAQEPLSIAPNFDASRWLTPESSLEFTLSRALGPQEGRLAVLVGDLDVSNLLTGSGDRVDYVPRTLRLPKGESDVVVYLVKPDESWDELARVPLRVLSAGGFEKADLVPRLSLNNKGQVAEGHKPETNRPPRTEFQDFSMNFGFQTMHAVGGWQLQSQSNFVGVSNRQEALRFGERQNEAPVVDLADYSVSIERGAARLAAGHVSFGNQRHLLSAFQSRGMVGAVRIGPLATLQLAGLSSTALVGWNNPLGLSRSKHRLLAANATLELVPSKPGILQVDASLLRGDALPQGGFTQQVVTDAESSRGGGLRLAAALPSQRVRLEAGLARSRFTNPFDATLAQGESIIPVEPVTRSARYLDLNLAVLQAALSRSLPVNLAFVFHHERVDPLYRSVAMPQVRADILQDAVELLASFGAVSIRASASRSHDNLDRIGTILGTQSRVSGVNVDVPAAMFFGAGAPGWLPTLSYGLARTHQFADSVPTAGEFPESFAPDQVGVNGTVGAQMQGRAWRMALRFDRSTQDNRQVGRERSDFRNRASTLSLGVTPVRSLEVGADLAIETARSEERDQKTTTRRLATSLVWSAAPGSTISGGFSTTHAADRPRTMDQQATDFHLELSQRLNLFGARSGRAPGQLFLRYSRLFGEQASPGAAGFSQRSWTLNTGANLSLF